MNRTPTSQWSKNITEGFFFFNEQTSYGWWEKGLKNFLLFNIFLNRSKDFFLEWGDGGGREGSISLDQVGWPHFFGEGIVQTV